MLDIFKITNYSYKTIDQASAPKLCHHHLRLNSFEKHTYSHSQETKMQLKPLFGMLLVAVVLTHSLAMSVNDLALNCLNYVNSKGERVFYSQNLINKEHIERVF